MKGPNHQVRTPSRHEWTERRRSVVDFNEVVVLLVLFLIVVVVLLVVFVLIVAIVEDVEGELDAQLGEENVVVGEEGVAQRQLGGFERGVVGLVSIACDVEVVLDALSRRVSARRASRVMALSLP